VRDGGPRARTASRGTQAAHERGGRGKILQRGGASARPHHTCLCGVGACADPASEDKARVRRATNSQAGGARHNTQLRDPVQGAKRSAAMRRSRRMLRNAMLC